MKADCSNCGEYLETSGYDYKGDKRWVHRDGNIQCKIFAHPKEGTIKED